MGRSSFTKSDPPTNSQMSSVRSFFATKENGRPSFTSEHFREGSIYSFFGGNERARHAAAHERDMPMWYALKYYYPAIIWAILMAAPIIMEGYETDMATKFFSYGPFKREYGSLMHQNPEVHSGEYVIPPEWQSGVIAAASIGQLIGIWVGPKVMNKIGYRYSTLGGLFVAACCLMIGFSSTFMPALSKFPVFLCGEFVLGIPWGLFQSLALPYVSDITPLKLKAPATTMINIFWLIGQLLSAGSLRGMMELKGSDAWAIRGPILVQYLWIVPLIGVIYCWAPESPIFLSRRGLDVRATKVLTQLSRDPHFDAVGSVGVIRRVEEHEKETTNTVGYWDCFRGINLRRTEIAIVMYLTQQLIGTPLISFSASLLEKAGHSQDMALSLTMGLCGLGIGSTLASMVLMRRCGRRRMWLCGLVVEIICLASIGAVGFFLSPSTEKYLRWLIVALIMAFAATYNLTIGPVCFTIVAETPATRLKASTNSIARAAYIIISIVNQFLVPRLLEEEPAGWGLGPKGALLWAGTSSFCLLWAFFRLPEMKDRTSAEIDIMFETELPTREWKDAQL